MSLTYGILGFLSYKPMSGYDLTKAFKSSLEFFWHAQNSQIYLELKNLEKKGYICGEKVIQSDRPNKKVFSITDLGKKEFMDWLLKEDGSEVVHYKSTFLMKIFFSGNITPAESLDKLRQFKSDCEAYQQAMNSIPASIENYGSNKDAYQTMYWQFTADFGYRFTETCIAWAQNCIEKLEAYGREK